MFFWGAGQGVQATAANDQKPGIGLPLAQEEEGVRLHAGVDHIRLEQREPKAETGEHLSARESDVTGERRRRRVPFHQFESQEDDSFVRRPPGSHLQHGRPRVTKIIIITSIQLN